MAYKHYKDNREFIKALNETGDLVTIEQEVDWDMELGAIVRRACEKNSPAPYFKKIKDYPGWEGFGAPLSTWRRLNIAMGLDPDTPINVLQDEYLRRITEPPIKPVEIARKDAPCKENILTGADVDLFKLVAPMVHGGDGGRYLCTWHMVVGASLKDPENVNWGMYRQMVFDETTMCGPVLPFSDMGKMFYGEYAPLNKPMPFATVIGMDPLSGVAACAPSPYPETEYTGQLMGAPVELVKCETSDLLVPAHSEIIIEGEVIPHVGIEEAPFGEYTGYRTSPRAGRTVYKVKCITYRNNPILTVSNMGVPTDEGQLLRSFSLALEMRKLLESQQIPISGVYMLPESTHHLVVVGVKNAYPGIAHQIGHLVFGSKLAPWFHMVQVVDEKTDIYNINELIHDFCTKLHPSRGIHIYTSHVGTPLYPFASPEDRKYGKGDKVVFDCLFPLDWPLAETPIKVIFSNKDIYPEEVQQKVLGSWKNYGFKD